LVVGAINTIIGVIDSFKINLSYTLPKFDLGFGLPTIGGQTVAFNWDGLKIGQLGIPSFATGAWKLANDTLANLHKGEMVVPAAPAQDLRDLWGGGNSSGGSGTTVHHTHVHLDGREIANIVDQYQGTRLLLSGSSRLRPTGG
jgi:hypothetical protein